MQAITNPDTQIFQDLVELAKANVSGPLGRQIVSRAQHDLVDRMQQKGLITEQDASDLKM